MLDNRCLGLTNGGRDALRCSLCGDIVENLSLERKEHHKVYRGRWKGKFGHCVGILERIPRVIAEEHYLTEANREDAIIEQVSQIDTKDIKPQEAH